MESAPIESVIPLEDTLPTMSFCIISNLWIKMMTFRKVGDFIPGHKHIFDHPTLLSQGSVEVDVAGELTTFTAPAIIYIERDKVHKITALEVGTVASCIHAIREGREVDDIIEEDMLPKGTSPRKLFSDIPGLTPIIHQSDTPIQPPTPPDHTLDDVIDTSTTA
jgi:hypothetical protein